MSVPNSPPVEQPPTPARPRDPRGRRLARAALLGVLALLVVGIPTDIIDTPLFTREIPVRWWEYPVLVATALLTAAWFAVPAPEPSERAARTPMAGVLLAVFAVGCPVCNKLVLLALGTSGALGFWAPLQPFLAVLSLGLLLVAVLRRRRRCSSGRCDPHPGSGSGSGDHSDTPPATARQ